MTLIRTLRRTLRGLGTLAGTSLVLLLSAAPRADAQCNQCGDPWINELFKSVHGRCPTGSGKNAGDCDIKKYGGGAWSSKQQLESFIRYSKSCSDPWISEAVFEATGKAPTTAQCTASLYGGGQWSSYPDLVAKVKAAQAKPVLSLLGNLSVADATGRVLYAPSLVQLIDPNGQVVPNASIVANNSARLIQDGGAYFGVLSAEGNQILGTIRGADGKTYKVAVKKR